MIFPLRSAIMQKVLGTVWSEIWLVMESEPAFMKIRRSRTLHRSGEESRLVPGVTLAIEPMITMGRAGSLLAG